MYFFSNRAGGFGKDDIYFAPFDASNARYGAAVNLGAAINSAGDEWAPVVAPDGQQLMFATDGHGGRGKHDLFVAHRAGKTWARIESLWTFGPSVSAHDPGALYFTSQHEQGRGRADIYRIEYQVR